MTRVARESCTRASTGTKVLLTTSISIMKVLGALSMASSLTSHRHPTPLTALSQDESTAARLSSLQLGKTLTIMNSIKLRSKLPITILLWPTAVQKRRTTPRCSRVEVSHSQTGRAEVRVAVKCLEFDLLSISTSKKIVLNCI